MNTKEFIAYQEETFDAFCKRVIHNESVNIQKELAARAKRETTFTELSESKLVELYNAVQPPRYQREYPALNMTVLVQERRIGEALQHMTPYLREVLLLYYFCDFTMQQIAALTQVRSSTVSYRLQIARAQLRQIMERMEHE